MEAMRKYSDDQMVAIWQVHQGGVTAKDENRRLKRIVADRAWSPGRGGRAGGSGPDDPRRDRGTQLTEPPENPGRFTPPRVTTTECEDV